jgi:hypothetical protein
MKPFAVLVLALGSLTVAACDKKKNEGLPPASKWKDTGSSGGGSTAGGGGGHMGGGGGAADPHAGMNMGGGTGADPHAGMNMGGGTGADPHAGMNMGGGDPHAGMDMGGGGGTGTVNPDNFLAGTITIDPKLKGKIPAGGTLYVSARRPDANGEPAPGMPLVVERLAIDPAGNPFHLGEDNAMTGAGTVQLTGDVVIVARYDQDGNPTTKEPGDVTGKLKVTVPAKDLKIVLDTMQQ